MNIANKTILITGANRGIGRALVGEALRRGAKRVYAATRSELQNADKRVTPLTFDVTNASQIQRAADKIDSLDVLINNAGIALYVDLSKSDVIEQHLAVNLFGPFNVTRAFLPRLIRSKGSIVNILSLAAIAAVPIMPAYSISKAAAFNMTQSLRALLAGPGREGPRRLPWPRRYRYGPRSSDTEGLGRVGGAAHLRWVAERRRRYIPRSRVPVYCRWLARGRRQGAREPVRSFRAERSGECCVMAADVTTEMAEERVMNSQMARAPIVSPEAWEAARQQMLVKEKALTRARDALAAERRRMPWMAVEKAYEFEGPKGKVSLLDLFEGRRQLIVYRAFFEPGVFGWPEHACRGCSLGADQVAHLAHLNARDTTLAYASRAPQADIARLKARMGWEMPWYTITDSFDSDFGVNEWHGHNAFIRDGDKVFRTYFINERGDEAMGTTWSYLDITALGRQEMWEDSPEGYPQTPPYKWWNWHDNYDAEASPDPKWVEVSDAKEATF